MASNLEIAIIGGGPGGLTLACILQAKGIHATVYEKEESANMRSQGGTLDIHEDSGQRALKEAGLLEQFHAIARKEGQDMKILDKDGKVYYDEISSPDDNSRPEIDRPVLRNMLLNSIKPENTKWGHNLKSISALENGKHTLTFENGSTATADLVVGADGAWSRVRPFVSPATITYSGLIYIEGNIPSPSPAANKLVGRGLAFALAENKGMFGQRNGDNSIKVYATLRTPNDWIATCGIQFNDLQQARARILALFSDWDTSITDLLKECTYFIPRSIYGLPVDHSWETKDYVTLIGDAAHVMPPSGEGVNQAMQDALELALAIANNLTNLHEALHTYEVGMFPRVAAFARESFMEMDIMYAPGAPQPYITHFNELMAKAMAQASSQMPPHQ